MAKENEIKERLTKQPIGKLDAPPRTEVTAEIAFAFRDGRIVYEDGFADLSPGDVLALDMQEGTLTLRSGGTSCQLGDVLLNLISVVCLRTPTLLENGEQAWFGAYSSELAVTFVPSDDTVSVIDEGIPPYEFPKNGADRSLEKCRPTLPGLAGATLAGRATICPRRVFHLI